MKKHTTIFFIGKWYYIKGKKKRFSRMVIDFTPKKEVRNKDL